MKKQAASALLAVALCLTGVFSAVPAKAYNVAVLPAWRNWFHVHDFDWVLKNNGYTFTNCLCTAEQMDYIVNNLNKYDLLIAPPLFNYMKPADFKPEDRPFDMKKYAPKIAEWIQNGGCFIGTDMNYPVAMDWYKAMDPTMEITANVEENDLVTERKCNGFGPPIVENNDSMLYFPRSVTPGFGWGHMVLPRKLWDTTSWEVISTCSHGKGFPTMVVRRWGKGIILLSSTRTHYDGLIENLRVNQKFSQFGVFVTESFMPDPMPGTNSFAFICKNGGDKPFNGSLELTLIPRIPNPENPEKLIDDPKAKPVVLSQQGSVAAGVTDAFHLDCRIAVRGPVHAIMRFRTGDTEAVIFERMLTLPQLFDVSGPPYRSIISKSRRFKNVTFTSLIYPNAEDISTCTVKVSVVSEAAHAAAKQPADDTNKDGKKKKAPPTIGGEFPACYGKTFHQVALPLDMKPGKYVILGSLLGSNGAVLATSENTLEIMPDGPGYAAFDEDNTLILEGEPFLPIGIYHSRDENLSYNGYKTAADVGFNVLHFFSHMGLGKLDILRPLDVHCLWEQLPHRSEIIIMEQSWQLTKHPSALLNCTMDEPGEPSFAFVRELDAAWRKYDPYHPTYVTSYQPHHFERNAGMSDILAPDPYPYSPEKGENSSIGLVAKRIDLARAASRGINPVFCVPQAFGCEPNDIWRNMGFQAITHGAKGIIYYIWNGRNRGPWGGLMQNPSLILEAEKFMAQMQLLAPAILGDEANQPRMFTGSPTNEVVSSTMMDARKSVTGIKIEDHDYGYVLHGMACRDPKTGTRYLLLANSSKEPLTMDIPLPEAAHTNEIFGAFDDTSMKVVDGVGKVELPKFGTAIYYWDGPRPVMTRPISDFAVRDLPARASGKTLTVAVEGAAYTNLQAAIDAAKDGDVIKVGEGDWGKIVSDNKLIDIVATGDRAKTTLSGGKAGRAATLTQRPRGVMDFETNTLVRGFTIQNGDFANEAFRPKYGGGVIGGTLVDCVVKGNKGRYGGGAAYANVFNCVFSGNSANIGGGGVSNCNVSDSRFEGNSTDFDGGAAEWSDLVNCTVVKNRAGRRGGGTCNGSANACRIVGNRADGEGGGVAGGKVQNCVIARNSARTAAGGAATGLSFCTVVYNTIDEAGSNCGVSSTCNNCLIGYNTSKADPNAFQISAYRNKYGEGNWYASANTETNDYPRGDRKSPARLFDASAFVDAKHDNYRPTWSAPFVNAASGSYMTRDSVDAYGNPRVNGGSIDVGAAELQTAGMTPYDIDASKADPFSISVAGTKAALAKVRDGNKEKKHPEVVNGALVFDGTSAAGMPYALKDIGASSALYSRQRYEVVFRTKASGPVFAVGSMGAVVEEDGKLTVTVSGNKTALILETAASVRGDSFNKLVVDVDKFGTPETAVVATLNGTPIPVKTPFDTAKWRAPSYGGDTPSLGNTKAGAFKGEIKSFKTILFAD